MGDCAPILFLVFNRPEQTARVFEEIRRARPSRLYVAADGPRPDRVGESDLCSEVREIATQVDWPCELFTLFHDSNRGCSFAVSDAIGWFFAHEGEGIILEDDCLPDHSFFSYCTELLERYRLDWRVGQVCGFNLLPEYSPVTSDYFPSHFGWTWGWASWRRAWEAFDIKMNAWEHLKSQQLHHQHPFYPERIRLFDAVCNGETADSCWDYQWHFALASRGQLSLVPAVSLVQNIGFTPDATHTQSADSHRAKPASSLAMDSEIRHPEFMLPCPLYEAKLIRAAHVGAFRQRCKAKVRKALRRLRWFNR